MHKRAVQRQEHSEAIFGSITSITNSGLPDDVAKPYRSRGDDDMTRHTAKLTSIKNRAVESEFETFRGGPENPRDPA